MADVCSGLYRQGGKLSQGAQKPKQSDDEGIARSASVGTKLVINNVLARDCPGELVQLRGTGG